MSTWVMIGATALGFICPAHMWWQQRRGRRPACAPTPRSRSSAADERAAR